MALYHELAKRPAILNANVLGRKCSNLRPIIATMFASG